MPDNPLSPKRVISAKNMQYRLVSEGDNSLSIRLQMKDFNHNLTLQDGETAPVNIASDNMSKVEWTFSIGVNDCKNLSLIEAAIKLDNFSLCQRPK